MMDPRLTAVSAAVMAVLASPVTVAEQADSGTREADEVIVISGSRMEQKLEKVAGSVVVIDEESIARNMSSDFATLFRTEAAVDVKGGAGKATSVTIRGIGGNRVMMVKDGVRVNNQYASPLGPGAEGTGRGLTEVEGLKQVEVLKAAASTIYGSDALGGVVVMNTKDADDYLMGNDHYFSANAGYTGMNEEFTGGFTAAASYNDFDNLLSYQHRYGEEQQNYDESLPVSDLATDSLLFKSKYHVNDHTNVQLTLDYLNQQLDRWEDHHARPESIDYDRQTQVFNGSLRLRSDKSTFAHDRMDVVFYYGKTQQDEWREYYDGNQGYVREITDTRDYEFTEERYGVNSTFAKALGQGGYQHNLTYGLDAELSEMSRPREYLSLEGDDNWVPSETDTFAFADTESLRLGAFIQDDVALMGGKLNLVMGLRYDYFENDPDAKQAADAGRDPTNFDTMSDGFWSPKLGLTYQVTDEVSVYTQYAYGYKMPTPDQKWGELEIKDGSMPFPVKVLANYDLDSESSHTIEMGVRGNHLDTSYEMTLFYTQANDYIDWEFVGCGDNPRGCLGMPEVLEYQYFNRDEVKLYGAEFQASHWLTADIQLWGNVAYTHGEDENGDYLNSVSPLKGTLGMNYFTYLGYLPADLGVTLRFADDMDKTSDLVIFPAGDAFNEVYNTAGYGVVDLTMGLELSDEWSLRVGVFNLFDKEYIEYADVAGQSKYLMSNLGVTEDNFTQPGRYGNVTLKYTFF